MQVIANWGEDALSYALLVESIRSDPQQVRTLFDGQLPLFRAVADDLRNVVVMLVALGADRTARDSENRTIIHVAAERWEIVKKSI